MTLHSQDDGPEGPFIRRVTVAILTGVLLIAFYLSAPDPAQVTFTP